MSDEVTRRRIGKTPVSVLAFLRLIIERRALLRELVIRDLRDGYQGSTFARWWALFHPLALISLYLFVFGNVFTPRLGEKLPEAPDFAVFLLSGLSVWLTVQMSLVKSASAVVGSTNLVKQVVFPIELLPVRAVLASLMPMILAMAATALYSALRFGIVSPMLPLAFLVVFFLAMTLMGLGLFFAALTVFIRDTREVLQLFTAAGLFLTPVLYLPGTLPGWFETAIYLNPFSHHVWCLQDVFFHQGLMHPTAWIGMFAVGPLALWLGVAFFERTRHNFGDAL
ncbi:ABC transporter permease [Phreatobacter sp.]|uniref:ABC transporter permease n=1 Tax=Phreatobacter sp. TaxID=1966341 RepID=UPI0022BF0271|nr:ABC transporter permease [Phreatobacter sp.]MCZ8316883.1 ABC transporter permease [Phreatobacter sp.]